jgi:tRNA A37 threonylcarbamoyladenosine dehydratase
MQNLNWQERTELLLGKEKLDKLKDAKVLVCGLGGVGGAAAEQLARAGVGNLCIIDADFISETNINRQIIATHNNIGEDKSEAYRKRLIAINPEIKLDVRKLFLSEEILVETLLEDWDFVIDAIDTLSPKIDLIRICYENKIPLVSSMGSGGKTDPSQVKITDIDKSYNCNLARILRKRLHRINIYKGVEVVFSSEKIDKSAVIEEESQNKKSNVGTISYMPMIFGCMCASVVIRSIAEIE